MPDSLENFASRIHRAYRMLNRLDQLPRTGYLLTSVSDPEKIASHCYSTSWLTTVISSRLNSRGKTLNRLQAIEMALLHDTGEIFIGDLVPGANQALGGKTKENAELEYGSRFLGSLSPDMESTFRDFFEGSSEEALLVRECDRLQLLLKAAIYYESGNRDCGCMLHPDKYEFTIPECRVIAEKVWDHLSAKIPLPEIEKWDQMPGENA